MSMGIYRESVKQHRAKAEKNLSECRRAYNSLRDKSTQYALELAELLAIHGHVLAVWMDAKDDVEKMEERNNGN